MLRLVAGLAVTVVVWVLLVWQAIDFGTRGRRGEGLAWVFLFLATVGAAGCLFMTMVLGGKIFQVLRGDAPGPPTPRPGGRRLR